MARYPGAKWRPLAADPSWQEPMARYDGIVLHTMVGSLWGTDSYFHQEGYSGTESHWGVGYDGEVLQWVDTNRRADANYEGTHRLLSIETADTGEGFPDWSGSNVPKWTDKQCEAIARIIAWAAKKHDFPIRIMENSRPEQRGVGWHRQGIDGNFPSGLLAGRVAGGERWSTSEGKPCPGDNRIRQIAGIVARAKELAGDGGGGSRVNALDVMTRGTDTSGRALRGTAQMFELHDRMNELAGGILVPVQGSFNVGVSASAGTHDKAGCWDWRSWNLASSLITDLLRFGRNNALALFPRTAAEGFDPHLHGTLLSDAPMTPQTEWQRSEYIAGRTMLASRRADPHYRPSPLVTVYDFQGDDPMTLTANQEKVLRATAVNVREIEALLRAFIPAEEQADARELVRDRERSARQAQKTAAVIDRLGELERHLDGNEEKVVALRQELRTTRRDLLRELADDPTTDPADNPSDEALAEAEAAAEENGS